MSMEGLCNDLLIHLTIFCDFHETLRYLLINRRFYKLFKSDPVWKKKIQVDFDNDSSLNQEKTHKVYYQYLHTKKNFFENIQSCHCFFDQSLNLHQLNQQIQDYWLNSVEIDWKNIQYVAPQTEQICFVAIKKCGLALEYVKEQTEKICLEAVKNNGYVLRYVEEQTEKICL